MKTWKGWGAGAAALTFLLFAGGWGAWAANPVHNPRPNLPNHNLIINGDMRLAQRGTSFTTLTTSQYTLDRWRWNDGGTTSVVVDITQSATTPTVAEAGVNFSSSIQIDVTTAETIGTDERLLLEQRIEAQDVTYFGHGSAGALTGYLSFWIRSTITGTGAMSVGLLRDDATERFIREVTISTTNTWERKTLTYPGDTSGTAVTDNTGVGLTVEFVMAAGTDNDAASADVWASSADTNTATSNQANLLSNASNDIFITGVQFMMGPVDVPFRLRPIAEEIILAHRYYNRLLYADDQDPVGTGLSVSTTVCRVYVSWPEMRVAPTVTDSDGASFEVLHQVTLSPTTSVTTTAGRTPIGFVFIATTGAVQTAGEGCLVQSDTTSVHIELDAEL